MSDAALRTPGLYLRALEAEAPGQARTALTAFVGVTARGPLDSPQIVGSYGEFVSVFGDLWPYGAVSDSVYAFFLNGGEEAAVVRVARQPPLVAPAAGTCATKHDLATAAAVSAFVDGNGADALRLAARNPGAWGNTLHATVNADSPRPMALGRLTASAAGGATDIVVDSVFDYRLGGTVRLTHASNLFQKSTHVVSGINPAARSLTLSPNVPSHGYPLGSTVTGAGFRLAVDDGQRREVFDGLSMNPTHPRFFVDVINGPANLPYLESARQGHSLLVTATQVFGPGGQSRFKPSDSAAGVGFAGGADGVTFAMGTLVDAGATASIVATAKTPGRAGRKLALAAAPFASSLSLAVPAESGGAKDLLVLDTIDGWQAGDTVRVTDKTNPATTETAIIATVDPDAHTLHLGGALVNDYPLGSTASVDARFNLTMTPPPGSAGEAVTFPNLSMAAGSRLFSTVVNADARSLVCLSPGAGGAGPPVAQVTLDRGTDPDEVPLPAFTGYNVDGTLFQPAGAGGPVGMAALEGVGAVNLLVVPDLVKRADLTVADCLLGQTQALFHCQKMGERFALLDVPRPREDEELAEEEQKKTALALDWPEHFTDPRYARYGALYHPWVQMAFTDGTRLVPPSGVMAGLFARVDRVGGVGQAPANVTLKGVVGLEQDIDAALQGAMNDVGVNCVRKFEVGAVRLWGARTLSREDAYLYVHNRRVVLAVIKGLSVGLRWAVFEPNDSGLQRRVKAAIEGFLRGALARGTAVGGRTEDAFFVNVGDDLNNDGTREAGQLIAEVGIAVAKPAEFIVITVKRTPDILTLVEEET